MTTIGEAFQALGYALKDTETVAIMTISGGKTKTRPIEDVDALPIPPNTYYSTGTFRKGTTFTTKGDRAGKNVQRILALPFDFDLKDFLNVNKEDLFDLTDTELRNYADLMRAAVEQVFNQISLPIHRLDYTGYGLAAHVAIPLHKPSDVPTLKTYHAGIVKKINSIFGGTFADPQVSDAGSRIMRLVPCENVGMYADFRKAPARQSETLYQKDGYVSEAMLQSAADMIAWQGERVDAPPTGQTLTDDDLQAIVDAYKPHHTQGHKHFMGLGVAGQLGQAGVSEEQALQIITALCAEDNKPWDRQAAVRDTYAKIREGVTVSGFYILRKIVPEDAIDTVDRILERARRQAAPRLIFSKRAGESGDPAAPISLFNPPVPPQSAFYGWHGRYLDLVYPTTAASIAFHLAASTTLQAALIGRRISTFYAGDRVYPNQYAVVVGPTGSSYKDTAYKRTIQMIELAQKAQIGKGSLRATPFTVATDVASREGLIRSLSRHNSMYLFATEITAILKNASRDATSTLLDALINIWDSPAIIQNNSIAAAQDGTNIAQEPTLNIYGGIQPSRMAEQMTETMMTSGLGNRMAIFMGVGRGKLPRTPRMDEDGAFNLYRELVEAIDSYPVGAELEMTERAGVFWDDWFMSVPDEDDDIANDMKVRYPVMIQKWALLFAVCDRAPAIDLPHIEAAISLGDWMWSCVKMLLPTWGTSPERKIEERILTVLSQRQPMLRRDLNRYVRGKWTAREFANVFRAMKDNHQIVVSVDDRWVALAEHAFGKEQSA